MAFGDINALLLFVKICDVSQREENDPQIQVILSKDAKKIWSYKMGVENIYVKTLVWSLGANGVTILIIHTFVQRLKKNSDVPK